MEAATPEAVTIGPVPSERRAEFITALGIPFGFDPDEGYTKRLNRYFEWDRALAAYVDDRVVGTIGAFSLDLTVPGGALPCAGTTVVSVLPTHRRRGILRMMIDAHLQDVRDRDEPIAGLWASDSEIYGRFGFGQAARGAELEIPRNHSRFHRLAPDPASIRLIDAAEAVKTLPDFYAETRLGRPGTFARSDNWWRARRFHDPRSRRERETTGYRYAVAESDGRITGYVQYRYKADWSEGHGLGEVQVHDLIASDPEAWTGLWRFILDHDLTSTIRAYNRPLDDPVLELLAAPRRVRIKPEDTLWVRIMDIEKALQGRAYAAAVSTVIQVHDPIDDSLTRWRLDLSSEGADVAPTNEPATVELDLEDLGACFLGWSRFRQLQATGRLSGDDAAIADLDRAFTWWPQPWCPEVF